MCLSLLPHPEEIEGSACHEAEPGVQSHCIHHRGLGVVLNSFFGEAMKMWGGEHLTITQRRLLSLRPKQRSEQPLTL